MAAEAERMGLEAIGVGIFSILIGLWYLLDRARLGLVTTRAIGQYFGGRGPEEEPPDAAVKPARGWYAFKGVFYLLFGIGALIAGFMGD